MFGRIDGSEGAVKQKRGWLVALATLLFFAMAFVVFQKITFLLRFPPYDRTTLWVPGALTFSALLLLPKDRWWQIYLGLCLGAFLAYWGDQHIPALVAIISAQFHFFSVALSVSFIRRFCGQTPFSSVASMLVFALAAGVFVPLATAITAEVSQLYDGSPGYFSVTLRSFLCGALGILIATPAFTTALLALKTGGWDCRRKACWLRLAEASVLTLSLAGVTLWVFNIQVQPSAIAVFFYAPIPFLLWSALRFEVAGTSWALLGMAYLATWSAISNRGPFADGLPDDHVLQLQLFFLALSLPLLFLAVGVGERRMAHDRLVDEIQERTIAEGLFRLVVDSTPNAIFMVNSAAEIVLANKKTEQYFGSSRDEFKTTPLALMLPERMREAFQKQFHRFFHQASGTSRPFSWEAYGQRADGSEFPMEMTLMPIDSRDRGLALISIFDTTERLRAEEAQRNLVHAARLATLSEFTASIAHEINQPLGAILSNAEAGEIILDSSEPQLDEVRRILADIRSDDLRASSVINRLRALLRSGDFERQLVDINKLVMDVVAIIRMESQRRAVEIATQLADESVMVDGDKVHLQQVLLNLSMNALEALEQTPGPKRITFSTRCSQHYVQIAVADTGPGLPPEKIPRLFDRFFTTKKQGMGLGLGIAQSLVEKHGGRMWAENTLKGGAVFHVELPVAKVSSEAVADDSLHEREILSYDRK